MTPRRTALLIFMMAALITAGPAMAADTGPPTMVEKGCLNCHAAFADMPGVLAGSLSGKALKGHTLQMVINGKQEVITVNDQTTVKNAPNLEALQNGVAMRVHYKLDNGARVATEVVAKPKIKVPDDQLIEAGDLSKLIEQNMDKGDIVVVDSRPPDGYISGHIPGAINIPLPKMKDAAGILPKDKTKLVVFYCQGFR